MKLVNVAIVALLGQVLFACGGGGSSSSGSTSVAPVATATTLNYALPGQGSATPYVGPQGIFDAPNGTFEPIVTILETGEVYGLDLIGNTVAGLFHGAVSGDANQISGTALTEYNSYDGGFIQPAGMSATYTAPALAMSLKFPFGTYASKAAGQMQYAAKDTRSIYDTPLSLASLAASYSGPMTTVGTAMTRSNTISSMSVQADGSFTAKVATCDFNGKLVPHGSKGVFDASVTVTGTGCLLNGDMRGIVVPLGISGSQVSLAFELVKSDARSAVVLYVSKV